MFRVVLASVLVMAAAIQASAAPAESALDALLARQGFRLLGDRPMPAFELTSLGGETVDASFFDTRPALILVHSGAIPVGLESPESLPEGLGMLVLTTDPAVDAEAAWNGAYERIAVCPGALRTIRALGGFAPPTWIVVLPGGLLHAARPGPLSGGAFEALIAQLAPASPVEPPSSLATVPIHPPTAAATATAQDSASAAGGSLPFLSSLERGVLAELNLARSDPAAYIEKLRVYRSQINGKRWERPGEVTVMLNEGRVAIDEAIAALSKQKPLEPFSASKGLSLAAKDHAADQGRSGKTGHTGSDGSDPGARVGRYGQWLWTMGENIAYGGATAEEFVMQLIVDDGVASRGHRKNIYNADFLVVGIATGKHPGFRTVCVMDFAGGYTEK